VPGFIAAQLVGAMLALQTTKLLFGTPLSAVAEGQLGSSDGEVRKSGASG